MKNIAIILVAALSLAACNHKLSNPAELANAHDDGTRIPVYFSVSPKAATTKVAGSSSGMTTQTANEAKINTTWIFVFNEDGTLDAAGDAAGFAASPTATNKVRLSCTTGDKTVWAVCNADAAGKSFSTITNIDALKAKTMTLNEHCDGAFVMIGTATTSFTKTTTACDLNVARTVSRIAIGAIKTDFHNRAHCGVANNFKLNAIYVTNVVDGNQKYSDLDFASTDVATWVQFNPRIDNLASTATGLTANRKANLYYHYDAPLDLSQPTFGTAKATAIYQYFYTLPNPTGLIDPSKDAGDVTNYIDDAGAKHTRVVLQTTLNGKTYYYPITLPRLEANKSYNINNIVIKRQGSTDPDEPVTSLDITFTVTCSEWTAVPVSNNEGASGAFTI